MTSYSKKVCSVRVNLCGTWIIITKYNKDTKQFDIIWEKDFGTERPDLYTYLDSMKKIKEMIK